MADTFTLTNKTPRVIHALQVEGEDFTVEPDESVDVPHRTALLLCEFGLSMEPADYQEAARQEKTPAEPVDTRHTGTTVGEQTGEIKDGQDAHGVDTIGQTRQHRMDDPRVNVAGTPLEQTGDTGVPTNDRAKANGGDLEDADTPAVPAVRNPKGVRKGQRPSNDPATEPEIVEHTQTDIAIPGQDESTPTETEQPNGTEVLAAAASEGAPTEGERTPGALSAAAAQAINTPASTGSMRAVSAGAARAPRSTSIPAVPAPGSGSTDTAWIDELDRKGLDIELERRGLPAVGMTTADKRKALATFVAENGSDATL